MRRKEWDRVNFTAIQMKGLQLSFTNAVKLLWRISILISHYRNMGIHAA